MEATDEFVGTRAVTAAHAFDVDALEAYLRDRLPEWRGPMRVEQFRGGQSNPTYKLTVGDRQYVLRSRSSKERSVSGPEYP